MSIIQALEQRRSYYTLTKDLPVDIQTVRDLVDMVTELVPDAFNMKSSRIVTVSGEQQDALWDAIYDVFGGKVSREKIDSFRAGAGTILYFYDRTVVEAMQEKFPRYAESFPLYANHASAMLQLAVWSALREQGIGASLQHYNPVIDDTVRNLFDVPQSYVLVAQMPFGGIGEEPAPKEREDIHQRVRHI